MRKKLTINKLAAASLLLTSAFTCHAAIVGPYTADTNTSYLFHLDGASGTSVAANSGSVGGNAYSVNEATASATPAVVTTVMGAAGFSGFGDAANFPTTGYLIGFDANSSGVFQGDVNGTTLSADTVLASTLNIGNGGQTPFTLEAMIFPTTTSIAANHEIICTDSSAALRGFQFKINNAGLLQFQLIGSGSAIASFVATIPTTGTHAWVANAWYHVAVTYDGTSVRLYWTKIDPSFTAANLIGTTAATIGSSFGSYTGPLCIGNENRAAAGELFAGEIDEVRISKVARAANDMLFKNGLTIAVQPQNKIVAPGGTVSFSITATTDFAPLSYQWRSNGVSLVDGGDISGSTTASLQIANVQSAYADGVTYDCVINNGRIAPGPDTATSSGATITIRTPLNLSWLATPADHVWNISSINWLDTDQSTNAPFTAGDNVTFDGVGDSTSPVTIVGAVQPATLTFNNASYTLTGGGKITGATGLAKTGSGTLTMAVPNDYTGVTSIGGGTVSVAAVANGGIASPLGAASSSPSNLLFDAGTLQYTGSTAASDRGATLGGAGGTLDVSSSSTVLTLSGVIAGTSGGGLTKVGNGTLLLTGANTYDGPTTISAGTLQLSGSGTLGGGDITNNSVLSSSGTRTITNAITGTGTLTNDATGTLTLSGVNSYSGTTTINGPNFGGLVVASSSALGNTPQVTVLSTTGGADGGTRVTLNAGVSTPATAALSLPASSTTVRSTLYAAGASSWNGPITLNGDTNSGNQIAFAGSGGLLTIGGAVGSSGYNGTLQLRGDGIVPSGAGGAILGTVTLGLTSTVQVNDGVTWIINSTGNTWGTSQIARGTLRLGQNNALPTSTSVQLGAAGNGILDLAGFSQQIGSLSTLGTAASQLIGSSSTTADSTLSFNSAGSSTYGGNIVDAVAGGTRKVALTIAGGSLTLSGTGNTYSGDTTVSAGTLALTGSASIANSANISLSPSGTLNASGRTDGTLTLTAGQTLKGSGTVVGTVLVASGSTIAAGSSVGGLTNTGSLLLQGGGTNVVEVMNATAGAGTGWDLLSVSGNVGISANTNGLFTIKIASLDGAGAAGSVTNFDNNSSYTWNIVSGNVTNFDSAVLVLDTSAFGNDLAGGTFGVEAGVSGLNVRFTNNQPPVANSLSLFRPAGYPLKLKLSDLATNWSDPDGDITALIALGASTNGATITTNGTYLFYTHTNDVDDSFSYTIQDLRNYRPQDTVRTAVGTVTITTTNVAASVQSVTLGASSANLSLAVVPGYDYDIQRSTNLVDWVTLTTTNAPAQGLIQFGDDFSDLGSQPAQAFYRMRLVP